jgi:hypothetical protein
MNNYKIIKMITIYILSLNTQKYKIILNDNDTLNDMKNKYHEFCGIDPVCQYLFFNKTYLDDDNKLIKDYGIFDNSIILHRLSQFI